MRLWKEVLLPGRQRDRAGNWFKITPTDVRRAAGNVAKMLSRGVPVPCVWEHQNVEAGDSAEHRAKYARHTFGHVAGQRVNSRGALELLHDVPDPADARQLVKTRFVSPKVYPGYSDSTGGTYRGTTIAHVAATPTPIQTWQRPFELSRGKALYLSYAGGPMADDDKSKDDDKGGDKKPPQKDGDAGTSGGEIGSLLDALREYGMTIPDEVTDIPGLIISIKSNTGGGDDLDAELDDVGGGAPGGTQPAGGAPMLMSDARAEPLKKSVRKEYEAREKAAFAAGKIDRPTALQTIRELRAVSMSFTRDGELVPNRIAIRIEEHEKLPVGKVWSKDGRRDASGLDLSDTRVEDPPGRLLGRPDDEKKVVDFMCAGLPAKK
jgi:hypothetical protein